MMSFIRKKLGVPFTFFMAVWLPMFWSVAPTLGADNHIPDEYHWTIERLVHSDPAMVQTGFEPGDLAFSWFDIPVWLFPLKITRVDELWGAEYGSIFHVGNNVIWYDNGGYAQYVLEGAILKEGHNMIRLGIQCNECEVIFNEGPIAIANQFLHEFDGPLPQGGNHILTTDSGCWDTYNWVYNYATSEWINPCPPLAGNFAIRAAGIVPLCPQRVGDMDGDWDIDLDDWVILEQMVAGPDIDIWEYSNIYGDLNNDERVDLLDFAVFQNNFTGGVPVDCPGGRSGPGEVQKTLTGKVPHFEHVTVPDPASTPENPLPNIPTHFSRIHWLDAGEGVAADDLNILHLPDQVMGNLPALDTNRTLQPRGTIPEGGENARFTYLQVAVTISIMAVLFAIVIGPCLNSTCRQINSGLFVLDGRVMDSGQWEEERIRDAMRKLEEWMDCNELVQFAYYDLENRGFLNPNFSGNPRINDVISEDDTEFVASISRPHGIVVIHWSYINGARWQYAIDNCENEANPRECAEALLALILFGEWQHFDEPMQSERQAQEDFIIVVDDLIDCGYLPEWMRDIISHAPGM